MDHRSPAPKGHNEIAQGKAKRRPGYGILGTASWVRHPRYAANSWGGRDGTCDSDLMPADATKKLRESNTREALGSIFLDTLKDQTYGTT
jgi:hypothetical protein